MQNTSKLTWCLIVVIFLMTMGALGQLTYIALEKEARESIAEAEKEFEAKKNAALLRIDSKLSAFISSENTRPYTDFQNKHKAKLDFNEEFVTCYFQINQNNEIDSPNKYNFQNLVKIKPADLNSYCMQVSTDLTNSRIASAGDNNQVLQQVVAVQNELSIEQLTLNSSYWGNKVVNYNRNKIEKESQKKSNSKKQKKSYKNESTDVNDNTRVEIAKNAYSKRGQYGYVQQVSQQINQAESQQDESQQTLIPQTNRNQVADNALSQTSQVQDIQQRADFFNLEILEGVLKPVWFQEQLLLIRETYIGNERVYQIIMIDIKKLNEWMQDFTEDLLPNIEVLKTSPTEFSFDDIVSKGYEQLALLPILINPNFLRPKMLLFNWTPTMSSIIAVWVCALLLTIVIIFLIRNIMILSVRRGEFASAVTHELRTPLTTFKMYSELLDEGFVKDEEKKKNYYKVLRTEAERLQGLVDNVLTFASIEKGNRGFSKLDYRMEDFLDQITLRAKERALKNNLPFEIVINDKAKEQNVFSDVSAIEQIVFNLVENACKYALIEDAKLKMSIDKNGEEFLFNIVDNGPGINTSHRKKLFSPFFKSDKEAANTQNGVGLGLALCRQLARQLGGDLKLNKSKIGADFTLSIKN